MIDNEYIKFDRMPSIYWNAITKASYLQRKILVHSILYYVLDSSVISDKDYDRLSKQLVNLRKTMSEQDYQKTEYYYCFDNFDGSTGFDLYDKLKKQDKKYLTFIAQYVLRSYGGIN